MSVGQRYRYLGMKDSDPALKGRSCYACLRPDGKCIVSVQMSSALVLFVGEDAPRCVNRRMLRKF